MELATMDLIITGALTHILDIITAEWFKTSFEVFWFVSLFIVNVALLFNMPFATLDITHDKFRKLKATYKNLTEEDYCGYINYSLTISMLIGLITLIGFINTSLEECILPYTIFFAVIVLLPQYIVELLVRMNKDLKNNEAEKNITLTLNKEDFILKWSKIIRKFK
ncbi:hypothetical protein [Vibrio parahaemolyticus]|uniref:hypothetical protein n=1 Tax=Vibrio parahaemolyticus TaxID=670 RepID=UPI000C276F27|nr:hypothetical protein [Vibrio parahaemolyticus]PJN44083.1 hypothetical protein CNR26_20115 [Vibrio parahaemolyticus]